MIIYLKDGTTEQPEDIPNTWLCSEVNEYGDLTVYRNNVHVLTPSAIAHYAINEWSKALYGKVKSGQST